MLCLIRQRNAHDPNAQILLFNVSTATIMKYINETYQTKVVLSQVYSGVWYRNMGKSYDEIVIKRFMPEKGYR